MKTIFALLLLCCSICNGQKITVRTVYEPCPMDTVKGVVVYQGTSNTHSEFVEGYFIAKCGGYVIGNYWGYENVPTFIPSYFIRNDEMINNVRQIHAYKRQKNTGTFTDEKFKVIPFESVYGLLVINLKK